MTRGHLDPARYGLPRPGPVPADIEAVLDRGSQAIPELIAAAAAHHIDPGPLIARVMNRVCYGVDYAGEVGMALRKDIEMRNIADAVSALIDRPAGTVRVPRDLWDAAPGPIHDRDAPAAVHALHTAGVLAGGRLRSAVIWAWTKPECPETNLGTARWRALFKATGWIDDGDAPRPARPVVLYRGAIPSRRDGLAWTGDPDKARWFADRFDGALDDTARVYRVTVPPDRVFARFRNRGEDEYVANVARLPVEVVTGTR